MAPGSAFHRHATTRACEASGLRPALRTGWKTGAGWQGPPDLTAERGQLGGSTAGRERNRAHPQERLRQATGGNSESFRRLDVVGKALVLQNHVQPGLDVFQLELITLVAELLEGVLRQVIAQPEAQLLADGDELQGVLLELTAHDDERLRVQVVHPHHTGQRRGGHIHAGDLAVRYDLVHAGAAACSFHFGHRDDVGSPFEVDQQEEVFCLALRGLRERDHVSGRVPVAELGDRLAADVRAVLEILERDGDDRRAVVGRDEIGLPSPSREAHRTNRGTRLDQIVARVVDLDGGRRLLPVERIFDPAQSRREDLIGKAGDEQLPVAPLHVGNGKASLGRFPPELVVRRGRVTKFDRSRLCRLQVDAASLVIVRYRDERGRLRGAVTDRHIDLSRSRAGDYVFDRDLGATDLLRKKRLEIEDVEGRACRPLRRLWKRNRVDAPRLPVGDEQYISRSDGKAGYRLDFRCRDIHGSTETAGNSDDEEAH